MKANELRIGNLVGEYGIPIVVTPNLILKLYQIEIAEKICIDITPIQLTDEWLVKFGFKIEKGADYFYCIKTKQKGITFEVSPESGRAILYDKKHISFIDLEYTEYIHQLQNLYFALTGKELEVKP